ncbi:hypothetical protein ACET3Z_001679 [Daucus carota]
MRTRSQARKEALELSANLNSSTMGETTTNATTDTKALKDFSMPKIDDIKSSIIRSAIAANTFGIKPGTIQMVQNSVQFGGLPTEDPNMHIRNFIEICDTFKFNGVSDEAVKLRLFPFSLRDKAKGWLHSLPPSSVSTWEDLAQKFLTKFFPMAKTAALRNAISQFSQQMGETFCESWERYKEMLRKCPHHGMPDWMQITCFYNDLGAQSKPMLDAASAGVLDLDASTAIAAQLKALTMKVDSLVSQGLQQLVVICELCAGTHPPDQCAISSESAQFVSNFQRGQQPAPATYHPNNRNHPNFSWSNNQNFQPQQQNFQQGPRQYNQAGSQQHYTSKQPYHPPGFQNQGAAGQTSNERSELEELRLMCKGQAVSIKTLETQIGQIANALLNRPQGTLLSDTEANPGKKDTKEQVQAITLRSGQVTKEQNSTAEQDEEVDQHGEATLPTSPMSAKMVLTLI